MFEKVSIFIRELVQELKNVVWPSKPDVISSTKAVILVTVLVSFFMWVVDIGLQKILSVVVG